MWMKRILVTKFFVLLVCGGLLGPFTHHALAEIETVALQQRKEVKLADQRLVGNVRAQAKREGVIVEVPELFIYYSDFTPAYHLSGYRATLSRELDLVINARRMERSMVHMDRLLERAVLPDGSSVMAEDLPGADLYVFLYQTQDCLLCDQVKQTLGIWLEGRSEQITRVFVSLD